MNRAIFLDIDEILTSTLSGDDVSILPWVKAALKYYQNQIPRWVIVGISNQGGNIENVIAQMQHTLELLPQLKAVYFCPDEKGLVCWRVTHSGAVKIFDGTDDEIEIPPELRHSKPGSGMIYQAVTDFRIDITQSWLVGEEESIAKNAECNFMPSDIWRQRFLPGMYEVKPTTPQQVRFLESLRFSNDNN